LPALATGALAAGTAADLQKVLDGLVTGGAPDAIGSVITADGQWSGAAGIDGPGGRAADPADEFNIASVSKTILAALVLRLAQDGKMDLDAPVSSYLGDLPINANGATVRQALAMRSGIRDTPGSLLAEASAHCDRVWTRADLLPSIPAPSGAADSAFYYSNPTYKMLGYVAEQVTGQRLETALAEQMFTSLGEDRILLQGPDRATPKPWALPIAGHGGSLDLATYGTGGTLPCISLSTFSFANSAIASDAPSLARWGWGLFSGTLLDQDSLSAMTAVGAEGYGLGIERLPDFVPDVAYGVHGSQAGYAAFLVIVPWRQAVAVLFINDENANVQGGARSLIRALRP
jgi:D-alanyl-D-alanine carboxypeptidase